MNIYLISARESVSYDCYDAHVVIASSPARARAMVPCAAENKSDAAVETGAVGNVWLGEDFASCHLIGKARKGAKSMVVLSSFNAG